MAEKLPLPKWTPKPHSNGTGHEPVSGVFHVKTGRTRQVVKWGAIIGAAVTLLTPVAQAIAQRIAPQAQPDVTLELRELRRLLSASAADSCDGGTCGP